MLFELRNQQNHTTEEFGLQELISTSCSVYWCPGPSLIELLKHKL